jgi:hypothetical protein
MGRLKELLIDNPYLYTPDYDYSYDQELVDGAVKGLKVLRNDRQHPTDWHEDMPNLMGEALAQAERDFLATVDLTAWEQLELDLWEGQHGIGAFTAWDLAEGDNRG